MVSRVSASVITVVYIRQHGVVSRVSASVITVGVYQVARCG